MIRSVLEYAASVWHTSLSQEQSERLESVQKRALRVVHPGLSYRQAVSLTDMRTLHQRPRGHRQGRLRASVTAGSQIALPVARAQGHWVNLRSLPKYPRIGKTNASATP